MLGFNSNRHMGLSGFCDTQHRVSASYHVSSPSDRSKWVECKFIRAGALLVTRTARSSAAEVLSEWLWSYTCTQEQMEAGMGCWGQNLQWPGCLYSLWLCWHFLCMVALKFWVTSDENVFLCGLYNTLLWFLKTEYFWIREEFLLRESRLMSWSVLLYDCCTESGRGKSLG